MLALATSGINATQVCGALLPRLAGECHDDVAAKCVLIFADAIEAMPDTAQTSLPVANQ